MPHFIERIFRSSKGAVHKLDITEMWDDSHQAKALDPLSRRYRAPADRSPVGWVTIQSIQCESYGLDFWLPQDWAFFG